MTARDLVRLVRVKQWTKGLFVFAALLFTRGWTDPRAVGASLVAFAAMTLASVAMYLFNDVRDLEADRAHPTKRDRSLASGRVGVAVARWGFLIALPVLTFGPLLAGTFDPGGNASGGPWSVGSPLSGGIGLLICAWGYLALQLAYNLRLKRAAVADVATIAFGFVLRVVAGAVAIRAPLSGWILLCTAFLALLIGFGKRRHEFHLAGLVAGATRPALAGYTAASLDALLVFSAACAALSYGVYSVESATAKAYPALILTAPFVVYGVMRYLVLVFGGEGGEPESLVVRDAGLLVSLAGFLVAAYAALSGLRLPFVG